MKPFFKKSIVITLIVILGFASLPSVGVSALEVSNSKPSQSEVSIERLERIWARQLRTYEHIGHTDNFILRIQGMIDRAGANGKDVTSVQSALDAFIAAVKEANPIYESMNGIVNSHQGFDANGKVTDLEKAKETVRAMSGKLREIKTTMDETGWVLREAIKGFRAANPRPAKTK